MARSVKGFQLINLMIDIGVLRIPLGALARNVGDAVHRVGSGNKPASLLDNCHHLSPQIQ